jgi:hypothetical protein
MTRAFVELRQADRRAYVETKDGLRVLAIRPQARARLPAGGVSSGGSTRCAWPMR